MLEDEINIEIHRTKLALLSSLDPGPTGKILAGNLTDLRFDAHDDLVQALVPYVEMREEEKARKSEDEERQEFVEHFKEWVKLGCPV